MLTRNTIEDHCLVHGDFTLRSGKKSSTYIDKFKIYDSPELLHRIAAYASKKVPYDTEVICGIDLGSVPLATLIAYMTNLPLTIYRKSPKLYGTCNQIEGASIQSRKVCVIEDIITTGTMLKSVVSHLVKSGASVPLALCIINTNNIEFSEFELYSLY